MWLAYKRDGSFLKEGEGYGRPMEEAANNELMLVGEIAYGHSVAVNLDTGEIAMDWKSIGWTGTDFNLEEPRLIFSICEETSIVGEYRHLTHEYLPWFRCNGTKWEDRPVTDESGNTTMVPHEIGCENGNTDSGPCENNHERFPMMNPDGTQRQVRNDILSPMIWRPIWFTRYINGMAIKVIGVQTTTPEQQGSKNIKKLISLFPNGKIGID